MSAFALQAAEQSHVGAVRKVNEDALVSRPEIGLFAVADGMGGQGSGDVASAKGAAALAAAPAPRSAPAFLADFEARVVAANAEMRALARAKGAHLIGTTLAALLIHDSHYACVWCGDSRVYLLRDGDLTRLTRDHSEVQDLLDRGLIDEDEARVWPRRNIVTRALGVSETPELEIVDGPVRLGDRFLLCSDGLTGHVTDPELRVLMAGADLAMAARELIDLTLRRGAKDNVTAVLVACERPSEKTVVTGSGRL